MPILRHLHSLIASALIFGTAVLLMLWVPAKALRYLFPGFLPYVIASHAETPVSELSLELLLLQVHIFYCLFVFLFELPITFTFHKQFSILIGNFTSIT